MSAAAQGRRRKKRKGFGISLFDLFFCEILETTLFEHVVLYGKLWSLAFNQDGLCAAGNVGLFSFGVLKIKKFVVLEGKQPVEFFSYTL